MSMIISVANQKGGVAKTTTAGALAAGLALRGYKVLALDLDPQGNLSFNAAADNENMPTMYEVLKKTIKISDAIQNSEKFDIVPANILLAGIEQEVNGVDKAFRLKESLSSIKDNYDFIVIDTPPALGTLTVNAFSASDRILIPSNAGSFAVQGIVQLYDTVKSVITYCNPSLKISGILLTKYNPRSNISKSMKEITENIGKAINAKVFDTFIRMTTVVEEAQAVKTDIFTYSPKATATEDYDNFITEFLEEEGIK
ncbi:ParA family protein (plasmid) [Oscillospiraceae bacterium PP1C4]